MGRRSAGARVVVVVVTVVVGWSVVVDGFVDVGTGGAVGAAVVVSDVDEQPDATRANRTVTSTRRNSVEAYLDPHAPPGDRLRPAGVWRFFQRDRDSVVTMAASARTIEVA